MQQLGAEGLRVIAVRLRRIGKLGGLSPERIEECLNDNLFLNALYQTSAENIERDGVEATPYLIIQPGDDQKVIRGAAGPDQLGAVIDGFLAE